MKEFCINIWLVNWILCKANNFEPILIMNNKLRATSSYEMENLKRRGANIKIHSLGSS